MSVTKHQKFSMEVMLRSAIKEHPQNPRIIAESAKKKLKAKMKEVGLIQPLIVNRTTGYLLESLDSLERYKPGITDYELEVAVVELDTKAELEMLVFLNNPSAMGSWDLDELATIALSGDGIELSGMGFDQADAEMMFEGDARFNGLFGDNEATKQAKEALKTIKQEGNEAKGPSGLDAFRAKGGKDISSDFYVVVVCQDVAEKEALMKHLHVPKGEQYISPQTIMGLVRK
jgi:hypothetical protein